MGRNVNIARCSFLRGAIFLSSPFLTVGGGGWGFSGMFKGEMMSMGVTKM